MTDPQPNPPAGGLDEATSATAVESIIPPEQPPMDDAAGGSAGSNDDAMTDEGDDLQVQGGE